jgi:beta-phosphoglucomutase
VDAAFEALAEGRLPNLFHTIVTSSDVERPKPDPSTYQNAVDGLGLSSENCLAIEDSPNGVRSAKDAGLRVLGVSAMHGSESLSAADWCVSSLEKISITDLIYLFQS